MPIPPASHGVVYLTGVDAGVRLTAEGFVAETIDRALAGSSQTDPSGLVRYSGIPLIAGQVVTNLTVFVSGAGAVITHFWLALYGPTGTLLAQSADSPTNFQSTGLKTLAMTAAYTVPTSGLYYAATLCIIGTTVPAILCNAANAGAGNDAVGTGQPRTTTQGGQTGLPSPGTIAGVASASRTYWVAAS